MAANTTVTTPGQPAAMADEARLIERAQAGDREAFGEMYRRCQPSVLHFAVSQLDNPADAEDIVAETFTTALTRISTFHGETDFVSWLLGIARYKMLKRWDRQKRHPEVALDLVLPSQGPNPEETVCLRLELAQLLSQLEPKARRVMVLQHVVGLAPEEAARSAGMSRRTVFRINRQVRAACTKTPSRTTRYLALSTSAAGRAA